MNTANGIATGQQVEYKPALITYTIYRINKNLFEISCMANGWESVRVKTITMDKLFSGEKKFGQLNWK